MDFADIFFTALAGGGLAGGLIGLGLGYAAAARTRIPPHRVVATVLPFGTAAIDPAAIIAAQQADRATLTARTVVGQRT